MSTGPAKKLAAYWDWTTVAEVPDARIVVCAPGLAAAHGPAYRDAVGEMWRRHARGETFVVPEPIIVGNVAALPKRGIIPALHVARQADLARLPDLLAVRAERRALVVSPEESITVTNTIRCGYCDGHGDVNEELRGNFVECSRCSGQGATIDVVFVVGLDKPVHPDWVRSIVEQCRTAGVPCVFLGWGCYHPIMGGGRIEARGGGGRRGEPGGERIPGAAYVIQHDGMMFADVGAERSGALLDGQPVEDVPAWLGGDHG